MSEPRSERYDKSCVGSKILLCSHADRLVWHNVMDADRTREASTSETKDVTTHDIVASVFACSHRVMEIRLVDVCTPSEVCHRRRISSVGNLNLLQKSIIGREPA